MRMAPPTAMPPRTREKTKTAKLVVSADKRAEQVKKTAVVIRTFFRPKRSLKKPATPAETTHRQAKQPVATVPGQHEVLLDEGNGPRDHRGIEPPNKTAQRHDQRYENCEPSALCHSFRVFILHSRVKRKTRGSLAKSRAGGIYADCTRHTQYTKSQTSSTLTD